jgi:undecaprenyl-diphosphatase
VILGLVEGLTDFLPVSSTGHLIIAGALLDFNDDKGKVFEVAIQFGAILAVCWEYRQRLTRVGRQLLGGEVAGIRFTLNLMTAFLPAAILGFLFSSKIKTFLFNPVSVASAFIVGGLLILWAERREHRIVCDHVDKMSGKLALKVGFMQALALIPGTSRSGATIIGGLFLGLSRQAATEFSFFLAMPTIFAATVYELVKYRALLHASDLPLFLVGFVVSFLSAILAVRGLLRYISQHDFAIFAYYRLVFGVMVLLTAHFGWVNWHAA